MWKATAYETRQSQERISPVRKCMGYLLLLAFINTIVFPTHSIVHHYVKSASLRYSSQASANLVEFLVEDCLDVTHPPMDAEETDVHDMEISLEDFDFIHHTDLVCLQVPIEARPMHYHYQSYSLFHSYLTRTTPPPEV